MTTNNMRSLSLNKKFAFASNTDNQNNLMVQTNNYPIINNSLQYTNSATH